MSSAHGQRWRVESWDPGYGASTDEQPRQSKLVPVLDLETVPERWRPLGPASGAPTWSSVAFVDGVRRIDAIGWSREGSNVDGTPSMGLFASYAAGAVCCRPGHAELLDAEIHRGLFTAATDAGDVETAAGRYTWQRVPLAPAGPPPAQQLSQAVQRGMRAAELSVSQRVRAGLDPGGLLVVDGPLHDQLRMPRTLGYAKTHSTNYLPAELNKVVGSLAAGQRTPVFGLGDRLSWYLKLPGGSGASWAGVVRVECWAETPVGEAVDLAAGSQVMLGRFASVEYKDARAPQNLYPIAGLERELRRRLGDQRLLSRAIRSAA